MRVREASRIEKTFCRVCVVTCGLLVDALGLGMDAEPAVGVRGGFLPAEHPLCGEWTVTVVEASEAVALIAKDRGTGGPAADRQFDYVITHDHSTVGGRCSIADATSCS